MLRRREFALFLIVVLAAAYAVHAAKPPVESKEVRVTGKLETGVVAVGGETTGIVVRTSDAVYELDLAGNEKLKQACEKLNQRRVLVVGQLRIVAGVEVPQRRIVRPSEISATE